MNPDPAITPAPNPKSKSYILWLIVGVAVVILLWWMRTHIAFDWHTLGYQLHAVSLPYVLGAIGVIYVSYWLRAVRWAILLAPVRRVPSLQLLAPQLIGFTAVALVGRLADLSART